MSIQSVVVFILCLFGVALTENINHSVNEASKDMNIHIIDELWQEFKEHNAMYMKQIKELQRYMTSNERRIQQLEDENEEFKIVNRECLSEMSILKTQVNDISGRNNDMIGTAKAGIPSSKDTTRRHSFGFEAKRSESQFLEKKTSFSAAIGGAHITELGKYQTVVFDYVFTNNNNGYSPLTGVFIAPTNGTYYFTATVMSDYGDHVETEISFNGNSMVYIMSGDSKYEQGHNSIILNMKAGDRVWVRLQSHVGTAVRGYKWSTFSGFQIDY